MAHAPHPGLLHLGMVFHHDSLALYDLRGDRNCLNKAMGTYDQPMAARFENWRRPDPIMDDFRASIQDPSADSHSLGQHELKRHEISCKDGQIATNRLINRRLRGS